MQGKVGWYMIIVIDGYNVLKQLSLGRHISEQERRQFVHMLSSYRNRKKHSIMLFFDGGPSTWPSKEVIAKVTVIYSGAKKTADAVIMKYMKEHSTKRAALGIIR
jgi:predicted RNA-binding protein with PIN domain